MFINKYDEILNLRDFSEKTRPSKEIIGFVIIWWWRGAYMYYYIKSLGQAPRLRGTPAKVWCGVVWCGVVWRGVVWCGVVWCGEVWCGVGFSI